ncbi:MAG: PEP-CTERM sorting domain-containing protein, partial [Planctomycetota bacterium]
GSWSDSDPSDGIVTSTGSTQGVNWSVTHTLPSGSEYMTSEYTLSGQDGGNLPEMTFWQYLDEDVYSISNNILVDSGSIADGNLDLLTVHPDIQAGVEQSADDKATGWAADEYSDLRANLLAGGFDGAPGGTVDTADLGTTTDPTYGFAYGPEDITTAIEWEIAGGMQSYSFRTALGGLPEAESPDGVIPEPATTGLLLVGLAGAGAVALCRRRKRSA